MPEFIELEAAVKAFNNFDAGKADSPPFTLLTPEEFAEYLYELPTADVAPVVRCKGCKHSWEDIGGLCCGYGPLVDSIVPEDFFCAYGEPKEGTHGRCWAKSC